MKPMNKTDEKYMKMCFTLAKLGKSKVSPNPMVGCVVLDKNGKLVSKGYHKKYGENHAERDALLKLKNNEAEDGTLYVNMEPCSHYGKTPPCVDIIIEKKIARVVYAMNDPNPKVDGKKRLIQAGIKVQDNVLKDEAEFLLSSNGYTIYSTTTMDGKIASGIGDSKWITSEKSRKYAKKLRQHYDCILTSANTVIADNPEMKHKFKCILDKDNKVSKDSKILKQGEIYIANKQNTPLNEGNLDLRAVLKTLYQRGICSVFVECGGTLAGALLKEGYIDEVFQFIAPKILNDNTGLSCFNNGRYEKISDCVNLKIYEVKNLKPDILIKAICINNSDG